MTSFTQKVSKLFFGAAIRVVTLALFLVVFGASAALAQTSAYVANSFGNSVSVIDTATKYSSCDHPGTISSSDSRHAEWGLRLHGQWG